MGCLWDHGLLCDLWCCFHSGRVLDLPTNGILLESIDPRGPVRKSADSLHGARYYQYGARYRHIRPTDAASVAAPNASRQEGRHERDIRYWTIVYPPVCLYG